jgi:Nucleotidyltransferase domain
MYIGLYLPGARRHLGSCGYAREHRYSRCMTGYPSPLDPAVAAELDAVREAILSVVGPSLVGLYLFGSLARGEFDTGISDIDLIAVLIDSPNEELAERLGRMHENLIRANPDWDDRIEVIYISREGLANCRTDTTTIGVISPGEPFHVVQAGRDWVLNWYPAREDSHPLIGPPIHTLIPPIPISESLTSCEGTSPASGSGSMTTQLPDRRHTRSCRSAEGSTRSGIAAACRSAKPPRGLRGSSRVGPTSSVGRVEWRDHQRDADKQDGRASVGEPRVRGRDDRVHLDVRRS